MSPTAAPDAALVCACLYEAPASRAAASPDGCLAGPSAPQRVPGVLVGFRTAPLRDRPQLLPKMLIANPCQQCLAAAAHARLCQPGLSVRLPVCAFDQTEKGHTARRTSSRC